MESSFHDVAIIGGGVVGCAIAHELGRYHADVVLLEAEAEVGFGTSKANSGIIHGGHHTAHDSLKGRRHPVAIALAILPYAVVVRSPFASSSAFSAE